MGKDHNNVNRNLTPTFTPPDHRSQEFKDSTIKKSVTWTNSGSLSSVVLSKKVFCWLKRSYRSRPCQKMPADKDNKTYTDKTLNKLSDNSLLQSTKL